MKKPCVYIFSILVLSCKSYKYDIKDYENDSFDHVKKKTLKYYNAEENKYSLLILTDGFAGEKFLIKNRDTILYNNVLETDEMISYAKTVRIDNSKDTFIKDLTENKSIKLFSKITKSHKYIYLRKVKYLKDVVGNDSLRNGSKVRNPDEMYNVVYSNTLLGTM